MLSASVAAGVTATFGAPIGGILFSIEVTSTYYMVSNLWRAFFCSVWGIIVFQAFSIYGSIELFYPTELPQVTIGWEYLLYILLGVICGKLGSILVLMIKKFIQWRKRLLMTFNRWIYCSAVALFTGLVTFPILII